MTRRRRPRLGPVALLGLIIGAVLASRSLPDTGLPWQLPDAAPPEEEIGLATGGPTDESGASVIGAWYEVAFTAPKWPDDPARHQGGLDERLVALISRAERTLDVAVYEFDLDNVAEAMARATGRGVRVRMVTDTDTLTDSRDAAVQAALAIVQGAGIPIVEDRRGAIMHHKFAIVDNEWVLTGSWNFTDSDTYRNNNNAIVVQSRTLAANYTTEFEKMHTDRTFGAAKATGIPNPVISVAGSRVESYFCPKDGCSAQIIRWIESADQRVHFMAFSFTHDGIGDAMLGRARAGVEVAGVFETTGSNTEFSEYGRMKQAGLDVLQDGSPWIQHHKVIVIDDRVIVFGSFNFSASADRNNDENLLIVDDAGLAAAFEGEYQRVRALALDPPVRQ